MPSFIMPVPSRDEIRRGIFYMVGAVFVFAAINVLVKWQIARYPLGEVVFFRCGFALLSGMVLVAAQGGLPLLRTRRIGAHLTRAVIQFCSMLCIFTAFGMMPLADAVAISFSTPLFLTVLSIPMLGEKVGPYRWGAVIVGFCGVLVMVRPGSGALEAGALFALGNAGLGAIATIGVRRMTVTEASATLVFYQVLTTAVLSVFMLPFGWVTPTWLDFVMLATIGLGSGAGQYLWTQAFRFAPAAVAAPFSYTAMIWAILFGYLIWGDVPTLALLAGALIVSLSGLFILYRETMRRTPKPSAVATAPGSG
jgi:drug/metabolite transporter (DMT)-like permease